TFASGHLMKEIPYREGRIDGQLRVWDENKKLVVDETYEDGRKLALKLERDDKGVKTGEGMCLEPPLVMDQPDDWWNARPARFTATGDVTKHGRWISWHPNGEKRSEGVYEYGLREGEFVWWFANRQKRLVGSFQSGKPQGLWIWWHENGQKASKGEYTDGKPTGAWAYWNKDGQLYQKHEFSRSTHAIVGQPRGSQPADRSAAAQTRQETQAETVDR
ncbi:MAG: hypothetical protein OES79_14170, partial [Planctomycetota bacterium]|nr:hypothetical protein [Planctomycetota bacterium]